MPAGPDEPRVREGDAGLAEYIDSLIDQRACDSKEHLEALTARIPVRSCGPPAFSHLVSPLCNPGSALRLH